MDAEGARSLARRIEDGRPPSAREVQSFDGGGSERCRVLFGLRIYRTQVHPSTRVGRSVLIRRRVCRALVAGRWVSSVVREDLEPLDLH